MTQAAAKEESISTSPDTEVRIMTYDARFYDQVIALVTGIQQQELSGKVTLAEQHDLLNLPGTYLTGKGNFWCAVIGGKVVGTIGLIDLGNGTGGLKKMFVDATHRGKEKALAQKLLEQLQGWARMHGFKHIYLGTGPTLHAAHRFYERNGFTEITGKPIPEAVLATLVKIDTKRYYKAL